MITLPKKAAERISKGLKRFQGILKNAQDRDINENDTVVIVIDLLSELFGYDKYTDLTTEYAIKTTYCDIAIKMQDKIAALIEVKAIGIPLKEQHLTQAVNYCANHGAEWAILTNGVIWRVYRIVFAKPISQELIFELDMQAANPKNPIHLEQLACIAKEGISKGSFAQYHTQKEATSRFNVAAILLTDSVLKLVRKELRNLSPDVTVETDEIQRILINEVLKRDTIEGEKADEAKKRIAKEARKREKAKGVAEKKEPLGAVIPPAVLAEPGPSAAVPLES